MSFFVVDVEADGPIPGDYSMTELGAVLVEPGLTRTFYAQIKPISEKWVPEALAISGKTREEVLKFNDPETEMKRFATWVKENTNGRATFCADNLAFDWSFVNWYAHHFTGSNPFGFSGRRIGDLYCGMERDVYSRWKHLRKTNHSHHPVDDAVGNAEALLYMKERMGLKIRLD